MEFQDPKNGGTYHNHKAYFSGLCKGIYPQNMALHDTVPRALDDVGTSGVGWRRAGLDSKVRGAQHVGVTQQRKNRDEMVPMMWKLPTKHGF